MKVAGETATALVVAWALGGLVPMLWGGNGWPGALHGAKTVMLIALGSTLGAGARQVWRRHRTKRRAAKEL